MGNTREVEVWEFKCISQSRDFYSDFDFETDTLSPATDQLSSANQLF